LAHALNTKLLRVCIIHNGIVSENIHHKKADINPSHSEIVLVDTIRFKANC